MSTVISRWLFLLLFLTWTSIIESKEIRVVCYYTNWSVYRPGAAKFSPQNINPYLCTHLIYAFGGFTKENTLKPFDKYQDIEKGGYAKFTGLKTYNKNLKTMLAIGGWNEGSSRFSPMVANAERRKELVKNAIKFLRQNHFDGLDLDWEYPSFRDGGKSRDRDNYAQLVQELREEFDRESEKTGRTRLLLTMAVPAGIEYINKGYDVPKLTKYLDWMNILSYDYHSAFEPAVNHHAPLFPLEEPSEYNYDSDLNIDYTIQHYLKLGAEANKLVMGIPTYGRSYTLFNPDANEMGSPADGPGDMGEATRENGYLAYYEICENVKSQGWEVVQPNSDAMGPYAFKDNQWVGYDDDSIARKKAEYVAQNGLGGVMFWSIDNDDFRGTCHGKPYPIIEAAKEALISAYGLTDENLVSPPAKPIKSKSRTRPAPGKTEEKKPSSPNNLRRRNRNKSKTTSESPPEKGRRRESKSTTTDSTVYSSLELVTPSYTTPEPSSTSEHGGGFKCEEDGFYPHPKDCKKYYWCLSGPGDTGIVAHQFTCPAGLYFNKAADSCDYTQNVLCNKKLSKATSTTTEATSQAPSSTTRRAPPKITAATSRTTVFRTTTTTEAPNEDEYEEYEDVAEEDIKNSEEDPKVIKELLDLIKKAGGIEQLEKQLKFQEKTGNSETTPSSISKSLVEKVLAKSNILNRKNKYTLPNRNSRGPQNEGLREIEEKNEKKGRPQYTTITRQRSQKSEVEQVEEETPKKGKEYVNIRRSRTSTTTEKPEETQIKFNRNKALGEEEEEDEEIVENTTAKKSISPQYVNIRRQRPSTTEGTSTTKYTVIRRGTTSTEASEQPEISSTTTSTTTASTDFKTKYKILRRGTTTQAPAEPTSNLDSLLSTTQDKSTTTTSNQEATQAETSEQVPETTSTTRGSTTYSQTITSTTSVNPESTPPSRGTTPESLTLKTSVVNSSEKRPPVQSEPRPFSLSTDPSSITSLNPVTEQATQITKVSDKHYKRIRQQTTENPRTKPQSRFKTTSDSNIEQKTSPRSRRRFSTTTTTEYYEDLNREYRPSGIGDLSSLTAVDFKDKIKTGTRYKSDQRRTRPSVNQDEVPSKRQRRPSFTNRADIEDQVKSSSDTNAKIREPSTERTLQRNRKIIRRFRPKTIDIITGYTLNSTTNAPSRKRTNKTEENLIESASANPLFSRRRSIRPPSLSTTQKINDDEVSAEEFENIKLSESNIRENSNVNNALLDDPKNRKTLLTRVRSKVDEKDTNIVPSTEPSFAFRTRKIIRKLKPTESSVTENPESSTTAQRKRKIIRRLRPSSTTTQAEVTTDSDLDDDYTLTTPNRYKYGTIHRSTTTIKSNKHYTISKFTIDQDEDEDAAGKTESDDGTTTEPIRSTTPLTTTKVHRTSTEAIKILKPSRGTRRFRLTPGVINQTDNRAYDSTISRHRTTTENELLTTDNVQDTEEIATVEMITEPAQKSTEPIEATEEQNLPTEVITTQVPIISAESSTTLKTTTTSKIISTTELNKLRLKYQPINRIRTTTESDRNNTSSTTVKITDEVDTESETSTINLINSENDGNTEPPTESNTEVANETTTLSSTTSSTTPSETSTASTSTTTSRYKSRRLLRPKFSTSNPLSDNIKTTTAGHSRSYRFRNRPTTSKPLDDPETEINSKRTLQTLGKTRFFPKSTTLQADLENIDEKPTRKPYTTLNRFTPKQDDTDDDTKILEDVTRNINSFSTRNKINNYNRYKTTTTTEKPIAEDTEAIKKRNKNLFNRKMNTPFGSNSQNLSSTTNSIIEESVSKPETTTELLTTLHHIFAETQPLDQETSTESIKKSNTRVEKLIEVNRIVEVHEKNETVDPEDHKVVDKIGVINRVTNVKIVDPSENEIKPIQGHKSSSREDFEVATIREIPRSPFADRDDRKYESTNGNKADVDSAKNKADIIDGRSNINIITPRPYYSTEASTIALQGLFQTENVRKVHTNDDELLETEHSKFVNVRILGQDDSDMPAELEQNAKFVPLKVLEQDEMKAHVVEVKPPQRQGTIKIVPIQVESTKYLGNRDFKMKVEDGVPKVNFKLININ